MFMYYTNPSPNISVYYTELPANISMYYTEPPVPTWRARSMSSMYHWRSLLGTSRRTEGKSPIRSSGSSWLWCKCWTL